MRPLLRSPFSMNNPLRLAITTAFILCYWVIMHLHKPLPPEVDDVCVTDKFWTYIIEPFMRWVYQYPPLLCPTIRCKLLWTSYSLEAVALIFGHWRPDSELNITNAVWNGVPVRLFHMKRDEEEVSDGAFFFIRGGGFMMGSMDSYESISRSFARGVRARLTVTLDYRLAPEHPYPAGLDDCASVADYLFDHARELGVDLRKIVVGGDSAGGNLAAALVHRRDVQRKQPTFAGQVLIYPCLQASDLQTDSYRYHAANYRQLAMQDDRTISDFLPFLVGFDIDAQPHVTEVIRTNGHVSPKVARLTEEVMDYSLVPVHLRIDYSKYPREPTLPDRQLMDFMEPFLEDPEFAPMMRRNLTGLPPAFVLTVQFDILRDEGIIYARRLQRAGVETHWHHIHAGFHGGLLFHSFFYGGQKAIDDCSLWIRLRIASIV